MKLITTKDAAEKLRVSTRRVQAMITTGRLPATKFGRDYLINDSDLELVKDRKAGRPPKKSSKD